ncbi:hypothetical protein BVY03_00345 [bacterium K02(2017)]|nr:hypothetical protein BVY03_00345 [bacterium K02(2017)]
MIPISIIIPAFNEESGIAVTINKIQEVLKQHDFEIIVVNDGSTDKTHELALACKVTVLKHHKNLGYGASLKSGIKAAKFDYILITDADGTYPPSAMPELISKADQADMVVGARTGKNVNIPFMRKFPKWCLRKLANYICDRKLPDLNSGLRIFKKEDANRFLSILPNGFSFTTTITMALICSDKVVEYISIDYNRRKGISKIRPIRDTMNFLILIIRLCLYFEPLKIFLPLSLVLGLSSLAWIIWTAITTHNITDAGVLTFIISLQFTVMGFLADLIVKKREK